MDDNGSGMAASVEIFRILLNTLAQNGTCTYLNSIVWAIFDEEVNVSNFAGLFLPLFL